MNKELLYTMKSPYRDDFRMWGFRFGSGAKSVAIVGAMRGDEIQQQFVCSQLVHQLDEIEKSGGILPDHEILVVPSANHFSMNIGKRFWAMDNTDINRMFPGFPNGETTQRIAAALFGKLQGYEYGIQLASFYMPGDFIPHVRMMRTGYENVEKAKDFGLPYVYKKPPRPFDTTLLNYNWQIWKTQAFSLYTGHTENINHECASIAIQAVLRFMSTNGIISWPIHPGFKSVLVFEPDLLTVKSEKAGIHLVLCRPYDHVFKDQVLARILDPYDGSVRREVKAPADGTVFFIYNRPLVLEYTVLFRIIPDTIYRNQ